MQRIFGMMLNDGIKVFQKSIDALVVKIDEPVFCEKLRLFAYADEDVKNTIRQDSEDDQVDLIVAILRSDLIEPPLNSKQIGKIFNAYVAWNNAVDNKDDAMKEGAQLFSYLKQLLKLLTRQRDKSMMLGLIEEPVTLRLIKDLFTIFYEPLVRVYKSANVYNSVTDFAVFIDDMIQVSSSFLSHFSGTLTNRQSRLSRNAKNKTSLPTPTKPYKPSSTSAPATKTTSTNSSTKCTSTTTAYSKNSWAGSKVSSRSSATVQRAAH